MNCANHVDVPAVAFCRTCGKPLCNSCVRDIRGVIYCEECLASQLGSALPPPGTAAVPPGAQPVAGVGSPRLAALLGFIPGVGAMYNGEYAKGFIHVLILGTLIWLCAAMDRGQVVFGLLIGAFLIYMPIEAYKTAKAREMGLPAPDPFGLNHLFSAGGPAPNPTPRVAAGAAPLTATTPSTSADWSVRPDRTGRTFLAQRDERGELRPYLAVLAACADRCRHSRADTTPRDGLVRRAS